MTTVIDGISYDDYAGGTKKNEVVIDRFGGWSSNGTKYVLISGVNGTDGGHTGASVRFNDLVHGLTADDQIFGGQGAATGTLAKEQRAKPPSAGTAGRGNLARLDICDGRVNLIWPV